jgi:hypothetical protein
MALWWLFGQYQNSLLFADFVLRWNVHYGFHKCLAQKQDLIPVNHSILPDHLATSFGCSSIVVAELESFCCSELSFFRVAIMSPDSSMVSISSGGPQV